MSIGLIIVDIQNDYFPGGKMELHESEQAGQVAGRLLTYFRKNELPLVHIQHIAIRPGATFFVPNSEGAEIHQSVKPHRDEKVIQKNYPNSFRETKLLEYLEREDIEQIVVAGMMTHMCVDATVRAATDYGIECLIAHDACATRNLKFGNREVAAEEVHAVMLAALNGAYGRVMSAEEIIDYLEKAKK